MRKDPKPHQIEARDFLIKNDGRVLVADPPGVGKTLSTVLYLEHLNQWPCLVVCPPAVLGHWKKEFEQQLPDRKAVIIRGEALCEGDLHHDMVILNYDILDAQKPWLLEHQYKCIVFDECDKLANKATKWTQAAMVLAKHCPRVMGLSGTPIANMPADFYPILNMIRPDMFGDEREYLWRYCQPEFHERFGWQFKGATKLQELHERIKPFMIRRPKSILNLPKQTVRMEFVDMENRETYNILHKQYVGTVRTPPAFRRKGIDKLQLLSNLMMLCARCKARGTVMWIRKFLAENPGEKLIVFAINKQFIDVVRRRAAEPHESVVIDGSTPAKKRDANVEAFQTDPKVRLAIINIKAGGAGITLTAAKTTVVAQLPWTPRDCEQLSGRTDRISQTRENEVIYLLTKDTIEEKLCKAIQEKGLIQAAILDGKRVTNLKLMTLLENAIND
jgi:SWI/SNF-related matrix-associated actin-dependent regulator 1 of chromatin subfamily A